MGHGDAEEQWQPKKVEALDALLSSPALDVRLLTALQVLQVLLMASVSSLCWREAPTASPSLPTAASGAGAMESDGRLGHGDEQMQLLALAVCLSASA